MLIVRHPLTIPGQAVVCYFIFPVGPLPLRPLLFIEHPRKFPRDGITDAPNQIVDLKKPLGRFPSVDGSQILGPKPLTSGRVILWPMLATWLVQGHHESQRPIPFCGTWVWHSAVANNGSFTDVNCCQVRTFRAPRTSAQGAL